VRAGSGNRCGDFCFRLEREKSKKIKMTFWRAQKVVDCIKGKRDRTKRVPPCRGNIGATAGEKTHPEKTPRKTGPFAAGSVLKKKNNVGGTTAGSS